MDYAIIRLGGKQYRVHEGETLVVDRLPTAEGKTFTPDILLGDEGATVTAKVVGHTLGPKIRIGKYRPKSGYRKHTGFRASLTEVQIESIGKRSTGAARKTAAAKPAEPTAPKGLPSGYAELTVAEVSDGAKTWNRPMLEAALAYEQENAKRKGALSAIESALAAKEGS